MKDERVTPMTLDKSAKTPSSSSVEKLLIFRVGAEHFGIPLAEIYQIIPMNGVARVPGADQHVLGVTQYRGEILPVVDLSVLFGGAPHKLNDDASLMIAHVDIASSGVACVIDELVNIIPLAGQTLLAPLPTLSGELLPYVRGLVLVDEALLPVLRLTGMTGGGGE